MFGFGTLQSHQSSAFVWLLNRPNLVSVNKHITAFWRSGAVSLRKKNILSFLNLLLGVKLRI
jgi:hypothetical protein